MIAKKLLESLPFSIRIIRKMTLSVVDGCLTLHQTRVLFLIKEGLGQSQIADVLQVSAAAVSKSMSQLSLKGLIKMKAGKDRRSLEISLTKDGTKTLNKVLQQVEKKLNKEIHHLSIEERDVLMSGLRVLDKLMGQIKEG